MMKSTTLVIMAAGIGSRFGGGIKQLTSFGPSGEIIMDYSIHDALEAGFRHIVFVIRKSMFADFKRIIGDRVEKRAAVSYVFQELDDLPDGFTVPEGRAKPWGTGQAILCCRDVIHEPFAVINADDYYGKDAFRKVHAFLEKSGQGSKDGVYQFCMAGFVLKNTLSEHGGVTRGLCRIGADGSLAEIIETRNVIRTEDGAAVLKDNGKKFPLDPEGLVSMNFWGFTPDFIGELETGFQSFLSNIGGNELKAEYLLPTIVDSLLKENRVKLSVLPSDDHWFGVTFKEDVPYVKEAFSQLIRQGVYPENLYGE